MYICPSDKVQCYVKVPVCITPTLTVRSFSSEKDSELSPFEANRCLTPVIQVLEWLFGDRLAVWSPVMIPTVDHWCVTPCSSWVPVYECVCVSDSRHVSPPASMSHSAHGYANKAEWMLRSLRNTWHLAVITSELRSPVRPHPQERMKIQHFTLPALLTFSTRWKD